MILQLSRSSECESPVITSIVPATAKGIVTHKACMLLKKHGGPVKLEKSWAISNLSRQGYVKRKAARTKRKISEDFDSLKTYLGEDK